MSLCEGGWECFDDFLNRHPSFKHFQDLPDHYSCAFESGLSVANLSVCNNIFVNFDSHNIDIVKGYLKLFESIEWLKTPTPNEITDVTEALMEECEVSPLPNPHTQGNKAVSQLHTRTNHSWKEWEKIVSHEVKNPKQVPRSRFYSIQMYLSNPRYIIFYGIYSSTDKNKKNVIKNVTTVSMQLKPERKLVVRILELKTGKSKNFSIYDDVKMESVFTAVKKYLEGVKK